MKVLANDYQIKLITVDRLNEIILDPVNNLGKFYAIREKGNKITWLALDNTTGDAWLEEFTDIEDRALYWLTYLDKCVTQTNFTLIPSYYVHKNKSIFEGIVFRSEFIFTCDITERIYNDKNTY